MATVPCPSCGMPRAEDLIGVTACPVCGATATTAEPLPLPEPPMPVAPVPVARPAEIGPTSSRFGVGLVGFVAGTLVGALGLLGWQTMTAPNAGGSHTPVASPPARLSQRSPRRRGRSWLVGLHP